MKHFIGGFALGVLSFMVMTTKPSRELLWPWAVASLVFGTFLGLTTWGLWPWSAGIVCSVVTLAITVSAVRQV